MKGRTSGKRRGKGANLKAPIGTVEIETSGTIGIRKRSLKKFKNA